MNSKCCSENGHDDFLFSPRWSGYEQQLAELREALSKGIRAGDSEAAGALRELIETVTVFRDSSNGPSHEAFNGDQAPRVRTDQPDTAPARPASCGGVRRESHASKRSR
jgi:hypothetical protein